MVGEPYRLDLLLLPIFRFRIHSFRIDLLHNDETPCVEVAQSEDHPHIFGPRSRVLGILGSLPKAFMALIVSDLDLVELLA